MKQKQKGYTKEIMVKPSFSQDFRRLGKKIEYRVSGIGAAGVQSSNSSSSDSNHHKEKTSPHLRLYGSPNKHITVLVKRLVRAASACLHR